MEPNVPPKLETFMRVLNRTGFDATDICKLGFDYSNAHPVLQSMMYAAAEQVEEAMKSIGIHALQLQGKAPVVQVEADPEWKEAGWKPADISKYSKRDKL